jgi:hypothetical protein
LKQKLWLLNFALIAALLAGGWRLRQEARELHARERATLGKKIAIPAPPPPSSTAPAPVVTASSYLEIAQKMLWSKDRNSQVILDPPKPPAPPKPLPALPVVHGVMDIGDGPIVMMSDKPGARHRGVRPGEKIGEFKLISANNEELVLGWEDRTVKKKLGELIDRGGDAAPGQAQAGSQAPAPAAAAAPAPAPPPLAKPEPGVKLTEGISSCQTNDPSPAGTVVNGMRKVIRQTPFGPSCIWEAVK